MNELEENMQFYMAPMEGFTGYVFRNIYHKHFGDVDKYFTPFISGGGLSHKEINDMDPEHNKGMVVVPQILTNKTEDFFNIAKILEDLGYTTVNLNLGCPSGTVVSKGRGAGFLAHPEELDAFLAEIFEKCPLKISIKTRLGLTDASEWTRLQEIYNKYPMDELIIHPRVRTDMYRNPINLEVFADAFSNSKVPVCYNGDICNTADYERITGMFPEVDRVMIGRGLFKNPGLIGEIKGGERITTEKVRAFHNDILDWYTEIISGDRNTLFKMKEIWSLMGDFFEDSEKQLKKIRKTNRLVEYRAAVNELFSMYK